jgi:hypothetical protein
MLFETILPQITYELLKLVCSPILVNSPSFEELTSFQQNLN